MAIKNGLWAVLFLGLFVFVIKDSRNREKKYQQTIKDLTFHLGIVKEIKNDIDDIKNIVFKNKNSTKKRKKPSNNAKNAEKNSKISSNVPLLENKMSLNPQKQKEKKDEE